MSAQTIYNRLRSHGMTAAGACAMLGNMQAESGLKSNIVQRGMQSLSDEEYTRRVDAYPVSEATFIHDSAGYGLCQWTFWSRKKALLDYAHDRGMSVGDESTQIDFCVQELQTGYSSLWAYLCNTDDTYEATERICKEYEKPAVSNINTRYGFAQDFHIQLADQNISDSEMKAEETSEYWPPRMICQGMSGADVAVAQSLLVARGANIEITGAFDADTKNRTMEFQNGVGLHADGIIGNNTWAALLRR